MRASTLSLSPVEPYCGKGTVLQCKPWPSVSMGEASEYIWVLQEADLTAATPATKRRFSRQRQQALSRTIWARTTTLGMWAATSLGRWTAQQVNPLPAAEQLNFKSTAQSQNALPYRRVQYQMGQSQESWSLASLCGRPCMHAFCHGHPGISGGMCLAFTAGTSTP